MKTNYQNLNSLRMVYMSSRINEYIKSISDIIAELNERTQAFVSHAQSVLSDVEKN